MTEKKKKQLLDKLVTDTMKIPTKDGSFVIAKQFDPNTLTQFIEIILQDTVYDKLNKRDKDDIEMAVNLIGAEAGKVIA